MAFCEPCRGVLPWVFHSVKDSFFDMLLFLEPIKHKHHRRFSDLEQSSRSGCPLCQMITKNLSQVQVNWRIEAESQTEMPSFIFKLSIEETPTRLTYEGGGPQFFMELQFYSLPSDRPIPLISTRHNHVEPNPLEVLTELLVPQLLPCIFNHPDCNSYLYFPPRLIDVGPPDGSVDPVLIESKTITESMDIDKQKLSVHATLSHCWGDAEHHVTTTTKNIDERMTCIPMSSLNKTFQDAITIVRALNREGLKLRYLWIDSICIIQDSKEDWERHSRMMSYIYSNSLVNIAATSAFNGSEGILHDRISGVELPLSPGISSPDRESTNLWIRALSPVEGSTLDSRAWVVQETILAPRTLYFGRNEASFRCRLLHCSEIHGINNVAVWHPDAKRSYFNLHQNFGEVIFDGLREYGEYGPAFKAWQRVVEVYSEKKLKFHRDKLPAISGIARHLFHYAALYAHNKLDQEKALRKEPNVPDSKEGAERTKSQYHAEAREKCKYYAGIWGGDLLSGLCWYARLDTKGSKYRDYIAPSWSWVSQDGPVEYLWRRIFKGSEFAAEVLDVNVDLADFENFFGTVNGGSLKIRGLWISDLGEDTENEYSGGEKGDTFDGMIFDEEGVAIEGQVEGLVLGFSSKEREGVYLFGLLLAVVDQDTELYKRVGFLVTLQDEKILREDLEERTVTIQ